MVWEVVLIETEDCFRLEGQTLDSPFFHNVSWIILVVAEGVLELCGFRGSRVGFGELSRVLRWVVELLVH